MVEAMRAAIEVQGDLAERNAGRALSAGLIDRVVPEADLEAEALSLARTLAARPPEAPKTVRDRTPATATPSSPASSKKA